MVTLAACGGSTTVAGLPDNFTGAYSGTVQNFPATLSIVQTTTTSNENGSNTTTTEFRGGISVNTNSASTVPDPDCTYNIDLTTGSSTAAGVSLSGENITVSLARSGSALTGAVTFTGDAEMFTGDDDNNPMTAERPVDCPTFSGAARFTQ